MSECNLREGVFRNQREGGGEGLFFCLGIEFPIANKMNPPPNKVYKNGKNLNNKVQFANFPFVPHIIFLF